MEQLEQICISVEEESEPKEEEKNIKIRMSVFFDGTLNNRTNINQRLVSSNDDQLTDEERKTSGDLIDGMTLEQLIESRGIYKRREGVGSYENGYTNVVKIERHMDTAVPPDSDYEYLLKLYIDGPGTIDNEKDKMPGYAIGWGKSGVGKKVKKALTNAVRDIRMAHFEKEVMIEKLTLDVVGFSRGSAAARNFIHKALFEDNAVSKQLKDAGYKVGKVEFGIAGLYDTVSSHGLSFSNDTAELNLDAVSHANTVVQLAAADEHRENFSLTTIESAGGQGIEIFLPGVHSDVGGSYRDAQGEDHDIFWTMSSNGEAELEKQKKDLKESGWYKEEDLTTTIRQHRRQKQHPRTEINLNAKRDSISNMYSRIPLHIMAQFLKDDKISFSPTLDFDEEIPTELNTVKQNIQQYVDQHKSKGAFSSSPDDWLNNKDNWMQNLRYQYFHFSARLEIGNGPRYINGRRQRLYFNG